MSSVSLSMSFAGWGGANLRFGREHDGGAQNTSNKETNIFPNAQCQCRREPYNGPQGKYDKIGAWHACRK